MYKQKWANEQFFFFSSSCFLSTFFFFFFFFLAFVFFFFFSFVFLLLFCSFKNSSYRRYTLASSRLDAVSDWAQSICFFLTEFIFFFFVFFFIFCETCRWTKLLKSWLLRIAYRKTAKINTECHVKKFQRARSTINQSICAEIEYQLYVQTIYGIYEYMCVVFVRTHSSLKTYTRMILLDDI